MLFNSTCSILRRASDARAIGGELTAEYSAVATGVPCTRLPGDASELGGALADVGTISDTFLLPIGADVRATDRFEHGETTYELSGPPVPVGLGRSHLRVAAKAVC